MFARCEHGHSLARMIGDARNQMYGVNIVRRD